MLMYVPVIADSSSDCKADSCSGDMLALSVASDDESDARMKYWLISMPEIQPTGLSDCAMLSRRVAVSWLPIERMYGFAVVSSMEQPPASTYKAIRKKE